MIPCSEFCLKKNSIVLWDCIENQLQEGEVGLQIADAIFFSTIICRTETTKAPGRESAGGFCFIKNGGDLLSHTVARAVPLALKSLTSVFGMGTGGSSLL